MVGHMQIDQCDQFLIFVFFCMWHKTLLLENVPMSLREFFREAALVGFSKRR